ncbi:MAG: DMT family protein [Bdellovibrionaceae bacterium]|nr:DMT family protein [Pseudobdellovibrionaceae bacterium]
MSQSIILLFLSNIFMTIAWYGHLKFLKDTTMINVILISWGIAFFEYCLQVPANRIGATHYTLSQLKIIQEVITLVVFLGFSIFIMKEPLKLNYLYAGICLCGSVYFIFK